MLGRVMSRKAIQIIQPCSWVDPPDVVAAEMAAEGASDRIFAERLGIDRMAARRHRIVRRQGFPDNGLGKLREVLAHRVGDVMRPAAGAASGG
jgi:hypothetical protein